MRKRLLISGYYGFGNTGDEAVLAGMLVALRQAGIEAEVTVLSADPARTRREHAGVESAHRYRILGVLRSILRADLFISGGGSLFQDVTSMRSLRYYLFVLRLAQALGRKTMIFAQGIGPLTSAASRRAVALTLNRTDLITVRDEDSKRLLKEIGVMKPPIHLCADPSFLVEPDLAGADRILVERGLAPGGFIGVSLRPWPKPAGWLEEVGKGIREACEELGVPCALIPMQEPQDSEVGQSVYFGTVEGSNLSPNPSSNRGGEQGSSSHIGRGLGGGATHLLHIQSIPVRTMKGIFARCGLVVGMRLHSLIFAAGEGVPFVPIVYDPKVASFAKSAGQPGGLAIESITASGVREAVVAAWNDRDALSRELSARASEMKETALLPARLARELLG